MIDGITPEEHGGAGGDGAADCPDGRSGGAGAVPGRAPGGGGGGMRRRRLVRLLSALATASILLSRQLRVDVVAGGPGRALEGVGTARGTVVIENGTSSAPLPAIDGAGNATGGSDGPAGGRGGVPGPAPPATNAAESDPAGSNVAGERLEFVHITKCGGTSVESAAAERGVDWGACKFFRTKDCRLLRRHPQIQMQRKEDFKCKLGTQPWHCPPTQFEARSLYGGAKTFAVVRNPYDR